MTPMDHLQRFARSLLVERRRAYVDHRPPRVRLELDTTSLNLLLEDPTVRDLVKPHHANEPRELVLNGILVITEVKP